MSEFSLDGQLILKLYELRRDPELREARQWYVEKFNPKNAAEIATMMVSGFAESAKYRMVTTYWEMAAALVNRGAINEQLFMEANTEHVAIMAKLQPFLSELREVFKEPDYLQQLEKLVMRIPNSLELLEKRRRLFERWNTKLQSLRTNT